MARTLRTRQALVLLGVIIWAGFALWRYQNVLSPEPIFGMVLIIGWLVIFTLACFGAGSLVLTPLLRVGREVQREHRDSPAQRSLGWVEAFAKARIAHPVEPGFLPITLAFGAGVLMLAAALLSPFHLLRPWALTVVLAAFAVAGTRSSMGCVRAPQLPKTRGLRLPAGIVIGAGIFTFLSLCTPSPFYDQLHYHLAFPYQWLRAGHIFVFPRQAYSFLPANMGLLFTYPLATIGVGAAQAIHWWMGAMTIACIGHIANLLRGPRAGWWAAAIFATCPSVLLSSTWAASDLGVTCFAMTCALMLFLAHRDPALATKKLWWITAGAMAGLAAGCKILALATVVAPLALFAFSLALPGSRRRFAPRFALWCAGVALVLLPWLVRNWVATQNPFYPFLGKAASQMTSSPTVAFDGEKADRIAPMARSMPNLWALASFSTFQPEGEAGAIGIVFFGFLPVSVLALSRTRKREARAIGITVVAVLAGWALGPLIGRYFLPGLALLAVLLGAGWQWLHTQTTKIPRGLLTTTLLVAMAWSVLGSWSALEMERISSTLGFVRTSDIMRRWVTYWPGIDVINTRLPENAKILLVAESRSMYLDRDLIVEDPFRTPLLVELAQRNPTADDIAIALHRMGVTHLLINHQEARRMARLNQTESYFSPLDTRARKCMEDFLARNIKVMFSQDGVEVYALVSCLENSVAFKRRRIPPGVVAPRSRTTQYASLVAPSPTGASAFSLHTELPKQDTRQGNEEPQLTVSSMYEHDHRKKIKSPGSTQAKGCRWQNRTVDPHPLPQRSRNSGDMH